MLKFATFTTDIELPFYTSLASHKINHDKLDDSARRLLGLYEVRANDAPESSCRLQLHGNSLTNDTLVALSSLRTQWCANGWFRTPAGYCRAEGYIRNVNTIEEYRSLDKAALLSNSARTVRWWSVIGKGLWADPPLRSGMRSMMALSTNAHHFSQLSPSSVSPI